MGHFLTHLSATTDLTEMKAALLRENVVGHVIEAHIVTGAADDVFVSCSKAKELLNFLRIPKVQEHNAHMWVKVGIHRGKMSFDTSDYDKKCSLMRTEATLASELNLDDLRFSGPFKLSELTPEQKEQYMMHKASSLSLHKLSSPIANQQTYDDLMRYNWFDPDNNEVFLLDSDLTINGKKISDFLSEEKQFKVLELRLRRSLSKTLDSKAVEEPLAAARAPCTKTTAAGQPLPSTGLEAHTITEDHFKSFR